MGISDTNDQQLFTAASLSNKMRSIAKPQAHQHTIEGYKAVHLQRTERDVMLAGITVGKKVLTEFKDAYATCTLHIHRPPKHLCSCGFYSYREREHAEQFGQSNSSVFIAETHLHGKVVVRERGYRAEQQTVTALQLPRCARCRNESDHVVFPDDHFAYGTCSDCKPPSAYPATHISKRVRVPIFNKQVTFHVEPKMVTVADDADRWLATTHTRNADRVVTAHQAGTIRSEPDVVRLLTSVPFSPEHARNLSTWVRHRLNMTDEKFHVTTGAKIEDVQQYTQTCETVYGPHVRHLIGWWMSRPLAIRSELTVHDLEHMFPHTGNLHGRLPVHFARKDVKDLKRQMMLSD